MCNKPKHPIVNIGAINIGQVRFSINNVLGNHVNQSNMDEWLRNHKVLWWLLSVVVITAVVGTIEILLCSEPTLLTFLIEYIGAALIAILFNLALFYSYKKQYNKLYIYVPLWIILGTMNAAKSHFDKENSARAYVTAAIIAFLVDYLIRNLNKRKANQN